MLKLIMCERFRKSKQTNTNLWAVESIGFIQFLETNCTLTFDLKTDVNEKPLYECKEKAKMPMTKPCTQNAPWTHYD